MWDDILGGALILASLPFEEIGVGEAMDAEAGALIEGGEAEEAVSPEIKPEEITNKTRDEIHDYAKKRGFTQKGDQTDATGRPKTYKDSNGKQRLRIDEGHVNKNPDGTTTPYKNPNGRGPHVHAYRSDGKVHIRDPNNSDPVSGKNDSHFPLKGEQ